MSRTFLALCLCFLSVSVTHAQLNYSFSKTQSTYQPLPITTPLITQVNAGFPAHDEGFSNNIPLGFSFNYNGVVYTSINANTNGYASFKPFAPITDTAKYNYWVSDVAFGPFASSDPTQNRPVLAPLWDDLDLYSVGDLKYETTGTAPNRVFTLQWGKVYWSVTATQLSIEFQLKLYEGTNVVEFQYNQLPGAVSSKASAAIGISGEGTGAGHFLSLNNTSASPTASSSVNTFNIKTKPATGQIYRFTPGATLDPNTLNYTFTAEQGTYTPVIGAVPVGLKSGKPGASILDEGYTNSIALFFPFTYDNIKYGQVYVHTNGFLSFKPIQPITDPNTQNYSSPDLASGPAGPGGASATRPILAPLWDDLSLTSASDLRYQLSGTAPNRTFTMEWANVLWNKNATSAVISFQVKLYEGSNVIEYSYNPQAGAIGAGAGAAIGITGTSTGAGNFLSLSDASANPTASSTVSTNTINTKPASGQVYRFIPYTAPVASNCTPTKSTTDLSVTASAADNFFPSESDTRQVVVTVRELGGIVADSATVRIAKAQASGYTFSTGSGYESSKWLMREDANFVYFERIGGMGCNTTSSFAINMTRNNPAAQQFNVTFRVLPPFSQSADYRYNDSFSVLFVSQ